MPINTVEICLDRPRKIYHQGEKISGVVKVENRYDLWHNGIRVSLEGTVEILDSSHGVSLMESFYNYKRVLPTVDVSNELCRPGTLSPGKLELPFRLAIQPISSDPTLYESYHGVFVTIKYLVKCIIKRHLLAKDFVESVEIMLEYDPQPIGAPPLVREPVEFEIAPELLAIQASRSLRVPQFKILGKIDSVVWKLDEFVTGKISIERSDTRIISVEVQLVRVETRSASTRARGPSRDITEVQNIQIADGNLPLNTPLPIYMILPHLFTCPTIHTVDFQIEFEINLVIIFEDNHLVTENIPIELIRSTLQPINSHRLSI